jgi:hypothetical protein
MPVHLKKGQNLNPAAAHRGHEEHAVEQFFAYLPTSHTNSLQLLLLLR